MNGMLGIGWLRASGCFVDYAGHQLLLPAGPADAARLAAELKARGYVPHLMSFNAALKRFYVAGALDGRPLRFDVGTVADNVVDRAFAVAAGVPLGSPVGQEGGPTGTMVDAYLAQRPMTVSIDGQASGSITPSVWDLAAYDAAASASEQATLGADFMLARGAVIDFGQGVLYLRS